MERLSYFNEKKKKNKKNKQTNKSNKEQYFAAIIFVY